MVESVRHRIHAISITSGVLDSIEEEEAYVLEVVKHLAFFDLPIGVSIYPTEKTPDRLKELGVAEVKFNLEAATPELFAKMCPGLDYDRLWQVLDRSVELFGKEPCLLQCHHRAWGDRCGDGSLYPEADLPWCDSRSPAPQPGRRTCRDTPPSAERLKKIFAHARAGTCSARA